MAFLRALEKSKPWDGKSHAVVDGSLQAHTPRIAFEISWARPKSQKDRYSYSVFLCHGNRLFWYWGTLYQIPESGYETVERLFPRNNDG